MTGDGTMKISSSFPSKFLKAADLPDGQFVKVTIDHVAIEDVGGKDDSDDMKPVLYLVGKQKGVVLNKTNSNTIAAAYGDETDDWNGRLIALYAAETTFNGQTVPCIRVKVVRGGQAAAPQQQPQATRQPTRPAPQPVESPVGDDAFDESSIPF